MLKMGRTIMRLQIRWLIFWSTLAAIILMIIHTYTFNGNLKMQHVDNFYSRMKPKQSSFVLPLQIHIYNKLDGFFSKNQFAGCNNKCYETSGTNNYNSSKYVLFLAPRIGVKPPQKLENQVWIFLGKESPYHHKTHTFKLWKNLVNWTMTNRRDSDIYNGYGEFQRHRNKNTFDTKYNAKNPKFNLPLKFSWMVSNCFTPAKRRNYVDLIQKEANVTVDVYGKCGRHKCPRTQKSSCLNLLDSKYPFYLSFENSLCVDYITEKAFQIYNEYLNMIPVVRGDNKSYNRFLPKNSYINVNEFDSVPQLVEKLKDIIKKELLFSRFFKWREHFKPFNPDRYCLLCNFLIMTEKSRKKGFYEDFDSWLRGNKDRHMCHGPNDL